jgi:hypothetical protein
VEKVHHHLEIVRRNQERISILTGQEHCSKEVPQQPPHQRADTAPSGGTYCYNVIQAGGGLFRILSDVKYQILSDVKYLSRHYNLRHILKA